LCDGIDRAAKGYLIVQDDNATAYLR